MHMYNIFLKNKYTKWYINIIEAAKKRNHKKISFDGYETHHIIPKSCGGSNTRDNLITLTIREHFLVHLLLIKMFDDNRRYKMYNAIHRMAVSGCYLVNSYSFTTARKYHAEAVSVHRSNKSEREREISRKNLKKACEFNKGRRYPVEHRTKISNALKGRKFIKNMPTGAGHHMSKAVTDGVNVFVSQQDAARFYNLTVQAICYRVKNKVKGWRVISAGE